MATSQTSTTSVTIRCNHTSWTKRYLLSRCHRNHTKYAKAVATKKKIFFVTSCIFVSHLFLHPVVSIWTLQVDLPFESVCERIRIRNGRRPKEKQQFLCSNFHFISVVTTNRVDIDVRDKYMRDSSCTVRMLRRLWRWHRRCVFHTTHGFAPNFTIVFGYIITACNHVIFNDVFWCRHV